MRYTESAENDLLDAWLFIAVDNLIAADRVVDTIHQEATHLLRTLRWALPSGVGGRHSELAYFDALSAVLLRGQTTGSL